MPTFKGCISRPVRSRQSHIHTMSLEAQNLPAYWPAHARTRAPVSRSVDRGRIASWVWGCVWRCNESMHMLQSLSAAARRASICVPNCNRQRIGPLSKQGSNGYCKYNGAHSQFRSSELELCGGVGLSLGAPATVTMLRRQPVLQRRLRPKLRSSLRPALQAVTQARPQAVIRACAQAVTSSTEP